MVSRLSLGCSLISCSAKAVLMIVDLGSGGWIWKGRGRVIALEVVAKSVGWASSEEFWLAKMAGAVFLLLQPGFGG
jgi:hypothetical protein